MTVSRLNAPLCVVSLTYIADLDAVDARMREHVGWLQKGYAEGIFLASGRKAPRTGGVILSRGRKAEVEALVATDPFVVHGVAEAEVTEFNASMAADSIATALA